MSGINFEPYPRRERCGFCGERWVEVISPADDPVCIPCYWEHTEPDPHEYCSVRPCAKCRSEGALLELVIGANRAISNQYLSPWFFLMVIETKDETNEQPRQVTR